MTTLATFDVPRRKKIRYVQSFGRKFYRAVEDSPTIILLQHNVRWAECIDSGAKNQLDPSSSFDITPAGDRQTDL